MQEIDPEENDRFWYGLVAGEDLDLLERLLKPKSAEDFLRRMQADPLLDHTRLMRVALSRRAKTGGRSLISNRLDHEFDEYMDNLEEVDRLMADGIPKGFVLTNLPEAMCVRTDGGSVVVISEVLRYALFFMNLGHAHLFGVQDVPPDVRGASLLIAARTMNLNESLDFDLDPRGVIPDHINRLISSITRLQIKFIIAHELSHYRLGHIFDGVTKRRVTRGLVDKPGGRTWDIYNRDWHAEFEADHAAINDLDRAEDKEEMARAAIVFFIQLECIERVMASLSEDFASIDTHPPTPERLKRIVDDFGEVAGVDQEWVDHVLAQVWSTADEIIHHGQENGEVFSRYGSMYLGQWRGPELVDRVDY